MFCATYIFYIGVAHRKWNETASRPPSIRLLCAHRLLLDPEAKAGTFASSATNSPHKQENKKDEIRRRLPLGTSSSSSTASSSSAGDVIVDSRVVPGACLAAGRAPSFVVRPRSSGARGTCELVYFPAFVSFGVGTSERTNERTNERTTMWMPRRRAALGLFLPRRMRRWLTDARVFQTVRRRNSVVRNPLPKPTLRLFSPVVRARRDGRDSARSFRFRCPRLDRSQNSPPQSSQSALVSDTDECERFFSLSKSQPPLKSMTPSSPPS